MPCSRARRHRQVDDALLDLQRAVAGVHQDQGLDPLRRTQRQHLGDHPAHRVAEQHEPLPAQRVGQRQQVGGEEVEVVGGLVGRLRTGAVTAEVGRDDVPAEIGQPLDEVLEVAARAGVAVHEHQRVPALAGLGDRQLHVADVDRPIGRGHEVPPSPRRSAGRRLDPTEASRSVAGGGRRHRRAGGHAAPADDSALDALVADDAPGIARGGGRRGRGDGSAPVAHVRHLVGGRDHDVDRLVHGQQVVGRGDRSCLGRHLRGPRRSVRAPLPRGGHADHAVHVDRQAPDQPTAVDPDPEVDGGHVARVGGRRIGVPGAVCGRTRPRPHPQRSCGVIVAW